MGENYAICLMAAMDRLWFHQIVLFSEPTSLLLSPQSAKKSQSISESVTHQSSIMSIPEDEEIFSVSSVITPTPTPQDDSDSDKETRQRRRSTDSMSSRFGSHSSLTWAQNSSLISPQSRKAKLIYSSGSLIRLEKSMSCKSLSELEVEEVKGFMDLGFEFSQSQLNPRMMSVLPGLQRLGGCYKNDEKDGGTVKTADEVEKDDEIEEESVEKRSSVVRPYLSEAWLIKRPDSPLLNLRVPRAYAADDMKKHLKYWARTVASVIQQQS